MGKYEEELQNLEEMFENCPLDFLVSLSFRLDCHILERDAGYQQFIKEMEARQYQPTLKVVK
jgi:hypothetical protein